MASAEIPAMINVFMATFMAPFMCHPGTKKSPSPTFMVQDRPQEAETERALPEYLAKNTSGPVTRTYFMFLTEQSAVARLRAPPGYDENRHQSEGDRLPSSLSNPPGATGSSNVTIT